MCVCVCLYIRHFGIFALWPFNGAAVRRCELATVASTLHTTVRAATVAISTSADTVGCANDGYYSHRGGKTAAPQSMCTTPPHPPSANGATHKQQQQQLQITNGKRQLNTDCAKTFRTAGRSNEPTSDLFLHLVRCLPLLLCPSACCADVRASVCVCLCVCMCVSVIDI